MNGKRLAGFLRRPTANEVRRYAAEELLELSDAECEDLTELLDGALGAIDTLDELPLPPDFLKPRDARRDAGYRPGEDEDPCNAFIRRCSVATGSTGPLSGCRVGVKDNIRVAGVPMTNASRLVGSFVPTVDAVVVERLLDAGAEIVGKLNMDDFSLAGTGETSIFGPTRNPVDPRRSPGGSSAGSGAAVAGGAVDVALATDQAGSGRIPAAWCGVASIKSTHGLVPTFGMSYLDHTLDFVCPIARSVRDVARTLQAIAGPDQRDPQWHGHPVEVGDYLSALEDGVAGLRVGIVREAFATPRSEADVDAAVEEAVLRLEADGAQVERCSVPLWPHALAIWNGFVSHSVLAMLESDLEGTGRGGACDVDWQLAFGRARRTVGAFDPSPQLKVLMLLGKHLRRAYCSTYFGKATNLRLVMTQQIDRLFEDVDVLVCPTAPMKAFELLEEPIETRTFATRSASMLSNTSPTNVTGHPSATVNCGSGAGGLPIGLQVIGGRFDEATVLRVARAVEREAGGDA